MNFGAFSVLSNFYISFLPNLTKFFVLVANFYRFVLSFCIQDKNMLQ